MLAHRRMQPADAWTVRRGYEVEDRYNLDLGQFVDKVRAMRMCSLYASLLSFTLLVQYANSSKTDIDRDNIQIYVSRHLCVGLCLNTAPNKYLGRLQKRESWERKK